jgi:hypothetical protein
MFHTKSVYITADTAISDVINNPAFTDFGKFIFPIKNKPDYDPNMRLRNINSLLPYHNPNSINTSTTINVINYMLDEVNNGGEYEKNLFSALYFIDNAFISIA